MVSISARAASSSTTSTRPFGAGPTASCAVLGPASAGLSRSVSSPGPTGSAGPAGSASMLMDPSCLTTPQGAAHPRRVWTSRPHPGVHLLVPRPRATLASPALAAAFDLGGAAVAGGRVLADLAAVGPVPAGTAAQHVGAGPPDSRSLPPPPRTTSFPRPPESRLAWALPRTTSRWLVPRTWRKERMRASWSPAPGRCWIRRRARSVTAPSSPQQAPGPTVSAPSPPAAVAPGPTATTRSRPSPPRTRSAPHPASTLSLPSPPYSSSAVCTIRSRSSPAPA